MFSFWCLTLSKCLAFPSCGKNLIWPLNWKDRKQVLLKLLFSVALNRSWDFFSVTSGEVVWRLLIKETFKMAQLLMRLGTLLVAYKQATLLVAPGKVVSVGARSFHVPQQAHTLNFITQWLTDICISVYFCICSFRHQSDSWTEGSSLCTMTSLFSVKPLFPLLKQFTM